MLKRYLRYATAFSPTTVLHLKKFSDAKLSTTSAHQIFPFEGVTFLLHDLCHRELNPCLFEYTSSSISWAMTITTGMHQGLQRGGKDAYDIPTRGWLLVSNCKSSLISGPPMCYKCDTVNTHSADHKLYKENTVGFVHEHMTNIRTMYPSYLGDQWEAGNEVVWIVKSQVKLQLSRTCHEMPSSFAGFHENIL